MKPWNAPAERTLHRKQTKVKLTSQESPNPSKGSWLPPGERPACRRASHCHGYTLSFQTWIQEEGSVPRINPWPILNTSSTFSCCLNPAISNTARITVCVLSDNAGSLSKGLSHQIATGAKQALRRDQGEKSSLLTLKPTLLQRHWS